MRKRVLSLLLAICLVIGLLPPTTLATTPATETPTEIVVEMYAGPSSDFDHITWTAAANAVFYATTDATTGRVTDITSTYVDDATTPWNIKLDNTKTVAELTLKDAYIYQASGTAESEYTYGSVAFPYALQATGAGALKIIVDGTTDSKIAVGYSSAINLAMDGTTTFTSVNNRKLDVDCTGSGYFFTLTSAGDLAFENANLKILSTSSSKWGGSAITAKQNLTIKGGTLAVESKGYSADGIRVTNKLSITDNASVTVEQLGSIAPTKTMRSAANGVSAATIEMGPAFLEIKDHHGYWNRAHTNDLNSSLQNKLITSLPTFVGVTAPDRMLSLYSTDVDDTDPQPLDPTDAKALLYSYLCFRLECGNHEYDAGYTDVDCNKCGAIRELPKNVTVSFAGNPTNGYAATWTAAPGEVYYATTTSSAVNSLGALTTEPAEWNIKLDNTKAVAELTLKDVSLTVAQANSATTDAITASGDGALKIIVDGTSDSTLATSYGCVLQLMMGGTTTITSVNNRKLTISPNGTGAWVGLKSTGDVVLENANVVASSNAKSNYDYGRAIQVGTNLTVKGSTLQVNPKNVSGSGIWVTDKLTITDGAKVTVNKTSSGVYAGNKVTADTTVNLYGVYAGSVDFGGGSLVITDTAVVEPAAEYSTKVGYTEKKLNYINNVINVVPDTTTLVNANDQVIIKVGNNADGSDAAAPSTELTADTIKSYRYVSFQLVCGDGNHDYTDAADPDCNNCGATREVPRTITVRVTTGKEGGTVVDLTKTIAAGEVYYGVADANGLVTSFEAATAAPADWDFKVDNTKVVAELVFNNAFLHQDGEVKDANGPIGLFNISGEGALKVITETASTLETGYGNVIKTSMAGGTTYTSTDNSLLNVLQKGTGGLNNIIETVGSLTFENANIYGSNKRQGGWSNFLISGVGAVNVNGGTLLMEATNCAVEGIYAGGNLVINNYAKVNLVHASSAANSYTATDTRPRHGVEVGGNIAIENASLRIQDVSGKWEVAVNKMPVLSGVNAEYSANADGSNASVLNPTDPSAKIEYPYVAFIYNCTNHEYDNDADFDCNKCGEVREVPRSVTVVFGNYVKDVINQEVVWNVAVGEIYYAKTNDEGVLTSLGALTAEPAEWNIKLDNTQPTAVLTLKNATLVKDTENGYSKTHHGIQVTGEGKLKIVVAGDSTITTGYNNPITTNMAGGTTYTSVNNSLLTVNQSGTSGVNAIKESKGNLTFDHANILAIHSRYATVWNWPTISAAGDMTVIGGKLDVRIQNSGRTAIGSTGISVGGVLTLSDYALVRVQHNATGTDEFAGGIDKRPTSPQYRFGVKAEDIVINNASLYITDNVGDMFEYAINKMPTLVGDVSAYYSVDTDGSNLQTLTAQNATAFPYGPDAAIEFPYVAFALICNNHEYDNDSDPECNKCGTMRDIVRDVTIQIITDDKKTQTTPLAPEYNRVVTVAPGEVYYGITNANGYVTEFVKKASEPAEWNIKLDNTKPVAELVFKDAFLYKYGTYKDGSAILNLLTVSGEGKLKIVTQSDSTLESYYGNVIATKMVGGTTYTSVNNALLTLRQYGTSGLAAIAESVGVLNFENANIHALNKRQGNYKHNLITAAGDMNVRGGNLLVEAINCSTQGIIVGGKLTLTDWASVRLVNEKTSVSNYKPDVSGSRYAVQANGDIIINEASLRISDAMNHWDVALNKSPKLTGVTAKYSEKADGSNLQALNPADPTAEIEYPYVEYVVNCAEHIWDNAADPNCNRCGEIRAVPYDIQVTFQFGIAELQTIVWDIKVGEVYYATTSADGTVVSLGKLASEPAKWNIKLDNTGAEAVLTFNGATITRKKRPADTKAVGAGGTITVLGKGALRVVTEKASTITTDEAYGSIVTSMDSGTTYESKNNAKLTLTGTNTAVTGGVHESVGNLTFENANMLIKTQKTHGSYTIVTVSTPKNMTVIGGKVEINASAYANSALNVKGDLLVKDNGILIVSTGSKANSGTCKTTPYGMNVAGDITVDNATLMVKNYAKYWGYMLNKMPTLLNGVASYSSAKSTKESKLTAFTMEAGTDMTELEEDAIFYYFSNSAPGTLDTSLPGENEVEEEEDDFLFDDTDNPFTGDTVNLTLLFALVLSSAAALVVLFSKKKALRE